MVYAAEMDKLVHITFSDEIILVPKIWYQKNMVPTKSILQTFGVHSDSVGVYESFRRRNKLYAIRIPSVITWLEFPI